MPGPRAVRRAVLTAGAAGAAHGAAGTILAGCAGTRPTDPAASARPAQLGGRIAFLHDYDLPARHQMVQDMVDGFRARHPAVEVEIVAQPQQYYEKAQALFASGTPPDVFMANPENFGQFVARGHLAALSPLIKRDRYDLTDFFPGSVRQYEVRGVAYLLPRGYAPNTFYVNLELFRQEGAPLPAFDWKDAAWTWTKFLEVTTRLTKRQGDQATQHGMLAPLGFRDVASWVYSNGGELWDRQGKESHITQPRTVETLQFIADLIHRHRVAPTREELRQMNERNRWVNRRAAMFHASASRFANWKSAGVDFDIAVQPKGAAQRRYVGGGGVGYALAAAGKRRDEAWALLAWLTGAEMQRHEVRLGEVFPPRRSLANSPDFLKPGEPPAHAALALEAAERHVLVVPPFTRWQEMTALMNEHLGALWDGRDTAPAVAARIKPLVDAMLKESPTPA